MKIRTAGLLAKYLKVSYDTILRWVKEGMPTESKGHHQTHTFDRDVVQKWLEENGKRLPM
jgi:excisionase family DNA binding protein